MNYIKYIILGVIQGITEPIPVSSSAHLLVFQNLFETNIFDKNNNFEIIVNFASFLAILFVFRKDVINLLKGFFYYIFSKEKRKLFKKEFKYCLLIILGSIPIGISGIIIKKFFPEILKSLPLTGISLIITALLLLIINKVNGKKDESKISYIDAIIIGLFAAFAPIPGISRSGITLAGCYLRDLKKEEAFRFTFMLYFPISIASMGLSILDITKTGNINELILPYILGFIGALVTTYFAIKWFFKIVRKGKLWKFAIYCLLVGLFILLYF